MNGLINYFCFEAYTVLCRFLSQRVTYSFLINCKCLQDGDYALLIFASPVLNTVSDTEEILICVCLT